MYAHPNLKNHPRSMCLAQGTVVEHRDLPHVPLVVVSGPHKSLSGWGYVVEHQGERVPVLEKNLKT